MTIDPTLTQSIAPTVTAVAHVISLPVDALAHGLVLAQQFQNVDVLANISNGWDDFLKTGKAGALVIGLILGYTIKGITK